MGCLAILLFVVAAPLLPVLAVPALAALPAMLFAVRAWRVRRQRPWGLVAAALAWLAIGLYERRMPAIELEDAAELRLDLLLVGPSLWLLSAAGVWSWRRTGRAERLARGATGR